MPYKLKYGYPPGSVKYERRRAAVKSGKLTYVELGIDRRLRRSGPGCNTVLSVTDVAGIDLETWIDNRIYEDLISYEVKASLGRTYCNAWISGRKDCLRRVRLIHEDRRV